MRFAQDTNVSPERSRAEIEMAWTAGLFEGEGTVALVSGGRRPYTRLVVSVTSTDRSVVEHFQRLWPANLREFRPRSSPHANIAWSWTLSCRRACLFLFQLYPYLKTRRVLNKAALAMWAQAQRRRGNRHDKGAYRARQRGLLIEMQRLNHRGTGPINPKGLLPAWGGE